MADKTRFDVIIDQDAMDIANDMTQAAINHHIQSGSKVTPPAAAICVATHLAIFVAKQYDMPPAAFLEAFKANLIFAGADMKPVPAEIVTLPPGDEKAN